ncbi:hypothetical protein Q9L42_015525 [Methylomarinum sp. Ch1-1]|uniref:Uncharacterized protein n=1 Tax=Methylomarinum roseum TaxID=3067653 RepID=A0AAU7NS22_9GAMM|nr:hypothetical protein [Methylomarinum sp. Ch1-1]MDP4520254.1 hypothetical protein [Methylomarinum sp. Ch1-1]
MALENELNALLHALQKQRDEIELQLHLAGMDVKDQWHKAEPKWAQFIDKLGVINDENQEASAELIHATKVIGDELKEAYKRLSEQLGE